MKFKKYLLREKTETVDYVNNGKIIKTLKVFRVSNQTLKSKEKFTKGYLEDSYGHRYSFDMAQDGWNYYNLY